MPTSIPVHHVQRLVEENDLRGAVVIGFDEASDLPIVTSYAPTSLLASQMRLLGESLKAGMMPFAEAAEREKGAVS